MKNGFLKISTILEGTKFFVTMNPLVITVLSVVLKIAANYKLWERY